jgi:A/G-specific adenine glycosylase
MNPDPWGVMVSEFMLQQTPVNRVIPAWVEWMTTWPNPKALATATPADAIRMWANLGYPRRAVRLHRSAQIIATQFDNQVPQTFGQLIGLPGVGEYTANAILAFAFDQPTFVMDINVRRVISRAWLGQAHPANSLSAVERAFAQSLVPKNPVRAPLWAAASMELGALVCTAQNPQCTKCPIRKNCLWFTSGQPQNVGRPRTQAKYEGSDRQERGRILRELRSSDVALPIKQLRKSAKNEQQFDRALQSLIKEELIIDVPRGRVSLPES